MIWIAYSVEVSALIVCAAVLNINGCPIMGWTMLLMAGLTSIKSLQKVTA